MRFITFDELNGCIYKHLDKIPDDIDLIVGMTEAGIPEELKLKFLNIMWRKYHEEIQSSNKR